MNILNYKLVTTNELLTSRIGLIILATVPNSFMERIETYDKAQYEPNSLFKALRGRLSTTTKSNQSK
jgi:hypothetical protein